MPFPGSGSVLVWLFMRTMAPKLSSCASHKDKNYSESSRAAFVRQGSGQAL